MTAADRIAALDNLPAAELCTRADAALTALVDVMNRETNVLRAGRFQEAAPLTAEKTSLAQDYVALARSVQREAKRLDAEAPADLARLRARHESLATQMAENLRVIATARNVAEDLLTGVAKAVGKEGAPQTYGAQGKLGANVPAAAGMAINRAL